MSPPRRAAFLDRDGVIIEDRGYVFREEELALLPGAAGALARLKRAGYLLIVVTNQSGIARGYFAEADMHRLHDGLQRALQRALGPDAAIDAFYFCPHHPAGTVAELAIACPCRKPRPGMIERALAEWPIDRDDSFMVGDKASDVEAGLGAGLGAAYRLGEAGFATLAECVDFVLDRRALRTG